MGNKPLSMTKHIIGYEDIKTDKYVLITTLEANECLIRNTLLPNEEIDYINSCISNNRQEHIIIYGKNYLDETIYKQYEKLNSLGFDNVYIYPGGIFEWLLLQDVYGNELFATSTNESDILKYGS